MYCTRENGANSRYSQQSAEPIKYKYYQQQALPSYPQIQPLPTMPQHVAMSQHQACTFADSVHAEVRALVKNSRLVRKSTGIALVSRSELLTGQLLGEGAFSEVYLCSVHPKQHINQLADNKKQFHNAASNIDLTKKYAVKSLKYSLMENPENFRMAAAELAVEAHMLASFDHPNIINIHGWAANGVASFCTGRHDAFFLLLDHLDETLDQRIESWTRLAAYKQAARQNMASNNLVMDLWRRLSGGVTDLTQNPGGLEQQPQQEHGILTDREQDENLYLEKLVILSEMASALQYLHSMSVIFRDLKPNNVGFMNGRVKLLDFGLSRELPTATTDMHQPFEMSGKVGTLRYMATEVACHSPYSTSADVYSWAMVAYEILTLEKPFAGWTRDMHSQLVCGRGVRPDIDLVPVNTTNSVHLTKLLVSAWDQRPHCRPTMAAVQATVCELEQDHLAKCHIAQPQRPIQVELPDNFNHDIMLARKAPNMNHSAAFTASTTMSMTADQSFDHDGL